jgi:molecular chaperone DnaJ
VDIPAGIHDGQRIRLTGEGHAGLLGGRAGDVYVLVRVRPDPRFVREGNDVISTVDLTVTQAALGTTVTVPTLAGDVELEFAAGTQPGEVRVLRGKGMPVLQGFGRGDHRLLVNVAVPRHLTPEQRRLLEEFERGEHERNYKADEGFFEKLRTAFR